MSLDEAGSPVKRPVEGRPSGAGVGRGGPARKLPGGRGFGWAIRTLKATPEWELPAEIERDPQAWGRALANIDRLLAQFEAERC